MTTAVYPEAELDVFDASPSVGFIEPIRCLECIPANRATARPERGGLVLALLVNVVMHQVPVARGESSLAGPVVVRSEDRGRVPLGKKFSLHEAEGLRVHHDVAVDENDDGSIARAHATIAGHRGSEWATCDADDFGAKRACHRGRAVGGTVINHDDLIRFASRSSERLKAMLQMRAAVPHWNDNA